MATNDELYRELLAKMQTDVNTPLSPVESTSPMPDIISPDEQKSLLEEARRQEGFSGGFEKMLNAMSGTQAYSTPKTDMDLTKEQISTQLGDALRRRKEIREEDERRQDKYNVDKKDQIVTRDKLLEHLKPKEKQDNTRSIDGTKLVNVKTGQSGFMQQGKVVDVMGNELKGKPEDFVFENTYAQQQTTNRQDKKLSIPSDKQVETINSLDTLETELNALKDVKGKVDTGPFAQFWIKAKQFADKSTPEEDTLSVYSGDVLANYVKSISGAQVTNNEMDRLKTIMPNIGMNDKHFTRVMDTILNWVRTKKQLMQNALQKYQGKEIPESEIDAANLLTSVSPSEFQKTLIPSPPTPTQPPLIKDPERQRLDDLKKAEALKNQGL
jgi:hypothetical protein